MKYKKACNWQICLLFLMCTTAVSAQEKTLKTLAGMPPIELTQPLAVDSTDRQGNSFKDEAWLGWKTTIPEQSAFTKNYEADTAGFFHVTPATKKPLIQLFSFYVQGNQYGKVQLKVLTSAMAEIFVDGKSVSTKTTFEKTEKEAKEISATIAPYPQAARIVIKLLYQANKKEGTALKLSLENNAKDSTNEWSVSNDSKRNVVLDDMIKGKRVTYASISPKGNYILLYYTDSYGENSFYSTQLYTIKTGRRVTIDTQGAKQQLGWMPQTERLFYISKAGEQTNLVTICPETLEEKIWAKDIPNEKLFFSPDEKALFYSKADDTKKRTESVYRMHTLTERNGGKPSHSFIYRYDLSTGLTRQLTFGSHGTILNDISNDGKHILFSTVDETITERPFRKTSLFCLNIETMQVDTLRQKDGFISHALFSPETKRVLILGGPEAFDGVGLNVADGQIANGYDTQAFLMDLSTKEIEPISKDFNPNISRVEWKTKEDEIFFQVEDEDHVRLYTYNTRKKKFTRLHSEEEVISGFDVAKNAPLLVYSGMSLSNSTRAYLLNLKTNKTLRIADPYDEHLSQLKLGEVKDWSFINSDDTEIKGYYYLPPDFDATKKYPMIVYYYGGTSPVERRFESRYPMHVYAALGYVVYVLQPSGATGFGQKFSALHVNTWGKRSSDDIIEGTKKFIAEHPFVDEKKVGCMGASYGGFMTMYLQTKTDMFAAAVSHAGISSISSYWGEGYWGYSYSATASAESYPWNNRKLYVDQSPLFNADKIQTPILFVHGTADTNVPPGESMQMYTALKILGKPTELVHVEGENHLIMNYKKRLKWNESIFAWFEKWLKGDASWWDDLYGKE